ncbi:MAG: hypothetical protein JWQ83_428 [Lacunisphaera sp.]|nr:hypothetical protein [Lacunisphaera sp.]
MPTSALLSRGSAPLRPFLFSRRWLFAAVLGSVTAVAAAGDVLDPEELKHMSVEQLLQQEVVSVSRHPETLAEAAGSIFYIPGDANRATGATSLPEMLRLAPSLFVAQSSSYHWGIAARGFMRTNAYSNKLLVLVDGRTAYSPLFSNVFWDSTDMFLPDIESIEVISGPAGSNWGANAVNGVINIQTKSAHGTIGGLLQVTEGTDVTQVNVRQGFALGVTGAMRIYARHTERAPSLTATGADDNQDGWHATEMGFRADWGDATKGEFTFQGDGRHGVYDLRPASPITNDSGNLILRWARDLAPDSHFWVRAYYDYVMRNTSDALTEHTRTADVEFQHRKDFADGQQLLWGANFRSIYDSAEKTAGFFILPEHLRFNLGSGFVQHEIGFAGDTLRLTTGVRLEHNYFTGWETQPTIRLAWRRPGQVIWLSTSRATRIPSRLDTDFFYPATPPYIVAGGPAFRSETAIATELGGRQQFSKTVAFTATAFYNDYENLRTTELSTPIVIANGAAGRTFGGEFLFDYDVTDKWRVRLGGFVIDQATWLKAGSRDSEHGVAEAAYPKFQVFLRSNYRLTSNVDFWTSLRRVDDVPANDAAASVVPAYTELNARLGWHVNSHLEVALVGRNLLSPSHPEIGTLATRREIERSLQFSVRYEY